MELYKSLVDSLSQKELMNKSNFEQMVDLRKVVKNKKVVLRFFRIAALRGQVGSSFYRIFCKIIKHKLYLFTCC